MLRYVIWSCSRPTGRIATGILAAMAERHSRRRYFHRLRLGWQDTLAIAGYAVILAYLVGILPSIWLGFSIIGRPDGCEAQCSSGPPCSARCWVWQCLPSAGCSSGLSEALICPGGRCRFMRPRPVASRRAPLGRSRSARVADDGDDAASCSLERVDWPARRHSPCWVTIVTLPFLRPTSVKRCRAWKRFPR